MPPKKIRARSKPFSYAKSPIGPILDGVSSAILIVDAHDAIEFANSAFARLFGATSDSLIGIELGELLPDLPPRTEAPSSPQDGHVSEGSARMENGPVEGRHRDGTSVFADCTLREISIEDRTLLVATLTDSSERLRDADEMTKYIQDLESAKDQSEIQAANVVDLLEEIAKGRDQLRERERQLRENEAELLRYVSSLEMSQAQAEKQAAEMAFLAESLEIEKERAEESRRIIEHHANHDPLTDLGNRALLKKVLPTMFEYAKEDGTKVGLIYIDLDNFKSVNDQLGHQAGDEILRTTAGRLLRNLRSDDYAFRLGGDEFAIAISLDSSRTEKDLRELANRIVDALTISLETPDGPIQVSASLGVALYPEHGEDIDAMLAAADSAMYRAKNAGKARVVET